MDLVRFSSQLGFLVYLSLVELLLEKQQLVFEVVHLGLFLPLLLAQNHVFAQRFLEFGLISVGLVFKISLLDSGEFFDCFLFLYDFELKLVNLVLFVYVSLILRVNLIQELLD